MKKQVSKFIAWILIIAMMLTAVPSVFAEELDGTGYGTELTAEQVIEETVEKIEENEAAVAEFNEPNTDAEENPAAKIAEEEIEVATEEEPAEEIPGEETEVGTEEEPVEEIAEEEPEAETEEEPAEEISEEKTEVWTEEEPAEEINEEEPEAETEEEPAEEIPGEEPEVWTEEEPAEEINEEEPEAEAEEEPVEKIAEEEPEAEAEEEPVEKIAEEEPEAEAEEEPVEKIAEEEPEAEAEEEPAEVIADAEIDLSDALFSLASVETVGTEDVLPEAMTFAFTTTVVSTKADVVFVVDSTGSMSDEINNVKTNLNGFTQKLDDSGVNFRIAVVEYKDITVSGEENSTKVLTNEDGTIWFNSAEEVAQILSKIVVSGGGDNPETVVDALGAVLNDLEFRDDASKFAIVLTDDQYRKRQYTDSTSV